MLNITESVINERILPHQLSGEFRQFLILLCTHQSFHQGTGTVKDDVAPLEDQFLAQGTQKMCLSRSGRPSRQYIFIAIRKASFQQTVQLMLNLQLQLRLIKGLILPVPRNRVERALRASHISFGLDLSPHTEPWSEQNHPHRALVHPIIPQPAIT